jgi:hypothetical protein
MRRCPARGPRLRGRQTLVLGLEMIRGLPRCYVPVPDRPLRPR